uniref:Retrovirus-related Pol polyprotein from transposon TNT 1-94 n=1 Tax=Tanacetum cinerariifolium TaxID=118510 RepID=A0A699HHZ2_TANCI|nr:hypothetical protein [Tanacetum cinerariifolium]GEY55581.1 hypothetical protein [Tanacetum cinerariifolium]
METKRPDADLQGTPTDQTTYRQMIGGLMYLTASRPDIAYATFICDFRFELIAYSDVDHAGCKDDCKSTSRGLQFLGGKLLCWSSKKQDCVAMSTAEAEYHSKTKHIDIRYHFIKEHVEKGIVELYFVSTECQLADLFTKALPKERFEYLVHCIVIIMALQQHITNVYPDEMCPPNKQYDLMDANKKIDLEHVQCPPKSKILTNIRYDLVLQLLHLYHGSIWKELSFTLDEFKMIFHLPQATNNNHDSFVLPPSFSDMIPFYKNHLGFTMELKTPLNFKTTGLLQPWQILCKIFSKCLTMRVTGWDQPPLQIMQMMYYFINNIHVNDAELLWEGIHYSLLHSTSSIPYLRFTKIIIGHYMTNFLEISRRVRDKYHNLKDDDLMKTIFNLGRYKDKVGMKILDWMISEEMKQTEHYQMYADVFRIEVPLTQSQPTESTQGMHRTPSALGYLTLKSTRLTPPAPVPMVDKADELNLQDTLQVRLAEHKSRQEQEARENVALVEEHLAYVEIGKMVEGQENVVDDRSIPRNVEHNIPGTRLEPRSDKESSKVEFTNVVIPVNVYDEEEKEDEITYEVYELKRREKGKFNDDDIEEQTSIWVNKKQKEPGKPNEVIYSNSMIIQVIKTYWELGHEYKFITELISRRANECIMSITEPDFKNLNKNDIEDMYLLIMNGKHEMFSIIYEPVHGIIYKNSKKEKRVMRHSEIHKFCDATLNSVLEGLKSYNNDVKYGYIQRDLTKDEVEYMKLFEEEIEDRLKYQRHMRRWESYVNGRPLGL